MNIKKVIITGAMLAASTTALADETDTATQEVKGQYNTVLNCDKAITIGQKNMFRTHAGFTPVDNSVTELSASIKCGNLDGFAWAAHNNETNKLHETDIGVGYSDTIGEVNYRAGFEKWYFNENGGDTQLASLSLNYKKIGASFKKFLDGENGSISSFKISEKLELGEFNDYLLSLNTEARATFVNNVFGKDGHTNNKYTASLNGVNGNTSITGFVSYHDGHNGQENTTQVGANINYKF